MRHSSPLPIGFQFLSLLLALLPFQQVTAQAADDPQSRTERKLPAGLEQEMKGLLSDYYTGKPVRAKVVIPANKHGLEIIDGRLKIEPLSDAPAAAQPGDLLLIKKLRFKNKSIEVHFHGNEEPDLAALEAHTSAEHGSQLRPIKRPKSPPGPRVILRFSREVGLRDLNLKSINRLLEGAVDVSALQPKPADPTAENVPVQVVRPTAAMLAERAANAQGIPTAPVRGDLVSAREDLAELAIDCPLAEARLYIDGAYSGFAPRTVRLISGIHTVLIVAPGHADWEQKYYLPPGKATFVRAELSRTRP